MASSSSHTGVPENSAIGTLLRSIPLLAKLTDGERSQLGAYLVEKRFNDKDRIITQGELGLGFYIITRGEVVVTLKNEKGVTSELGRLKEGDYFGETALINNAKRGASVTAVGPVTTFYLERANFNALFGQDCLNVQFAKRKAVTAEGRVVGVSSSAVTSTPANAVKDKTPQQIALLHEAMKNNVLFMNLDSEHKSQIIAEMYRTEIKEGTAAIKQGDLGDNLYVVESGVFHVFVNSKQVAVRGKGTCFGELALMYNSPRAATVMASTDCVVWVIDRFSFRRIVTDLSEKKFSVYVSFLKKVELLAPLAEYERKKIAEALEEVSFGANMPVFKQGDIGDSMYLVYSGEVRITKKELNNGVPVGEEKEVLRCHSGDYFGERALITNEVRAASVYTVSSCVLLKLDRNAFSLLLGPLEDIMKKRVESYNQVNLQLERLALEEKKQAAAAASSSSSGPVKSDILIEDLKPIATLGKGSFGFVQLVQHKKTGQTYALKAVNKAQIVATGQQGHVMSEKRVMSVLSHPFLVHLHATYKDKNRLFFLLDPVMGGELFSVLREKTLFDEDTAKFYAAQIILAFEYMHSMNIIYRDLKPENLLLDNNGYLKITDFGFAKDIGDGRTWTLCGCLRSDQLVLCADGSSIAARDVKRGMLLAGEKGAIAVTTTWHDVHPHQPLPRMDTFVRIVHADGTEYVVTCEQPYEHTLTLRCNVEPVLRRTELDARGLVRLAIVGLDVATLQLASRVEQVYRVGAAAPADPAALSFPTLEACEAHLWSVYAQLSASEPASEPSPFASPRKRAYPHRGDHFDVKVSVLLRADRKVWDAAADAPITVTGIRLAPGCGDAPTPAAVAIARVEVLSYAAEGGAEFAPFSVVDDGCKGNGRYLLANGILTHNTPDYLSPEIVAGKGHGKGVDWWTLGIFIYEMLASYPPFYDEDPMKTYAKIMQGTINFPSHFSKEAVSLIKKLLQQKPTKRLGVVNGGAAEIKKHPWFKNFDWDGLLERKVPASIVPKISSALDTSNFDDYGTEQQVIEPYVDDGSNWDAEF